MHSPSAQLDPEWVQRILEVQDALVMVIDPTGLVVYFNRACEAVSGRPSGEVVGRRFWEVLIAEKDWERTRRDYVSAAAGGLPDLAYENEWCDAEGRRRLISWRHATVTGPDGSGGWVVATGIEVTELRESEARFRWLSSATIEGITHHDRGTIVDVNERCAEIFGYTVEEMIGRSVLTFATEASGAIILDRIRGGLTGAYEVVGLRKDGSTFPLEIVTRLSTKDGRPLRIAGLRDISERKRLEAERAAAEEQLARAQRLESVGVLAGGVAHDFNNLLSVILGYGQLALEDERVPIDIRADLREVVAATNMAAKLTSQLLVFAKREPVAATPLSVNETLTEMLPLLERSLKEDVALEVALCDQPWPARIGRVHLEQVIVNLALNARDAMPRGGRVRLETHNVTRKEPGAVTSGPLAAGDYVMIRVRDDGVGMTPEVLGRVFEPFYSTKRDRARTGLGMAVVYGVVNSLGGGADIVSAPGAGCTVDVFLPRGEAIAAASERATASRDPARATILVVEDKVALLRLAERALASAGHRVLSASSGPAALEVLDSMKGDLDVLVTDVIMPGMPGPELVAAVEARHPGAAVLFISGYSDDVLSAHELSGRQFLAKPFGPAELLARVEALLADGSEA